MAQNSRIALLFLNRACLFLFLTPGYGNVEEEEEEEVSLPLNIITPKQVSAKPRHIALLACKLFF